MVFRFNIEYKTVYGENLVLNLNMDNEEVHNSLGTTDGASLVVRSGCDSQD